MSTWLGVSVAVPLGIGLCTSFGALRTGASEWHIRLRKPKYNVPHSALLPVFCILYTFQGIASYLVANEMVVPQKTAELVAARAGHLGLGFYWLQLTFLVFWVPLLAFGPSLKLATADIGGSAVFQLLAMIEFFRLSVSGGLIMLVSFLATTALTFWNAALI
ncbi:hypothetical protein GGI12_001404 [Dipsacomyces acuminosporus]|nr:hypothetical protein GGI12_001404 [Dipsacomyces acuminosporus]